MAAVTDDNAPVVLTRRFGAILDPETRRAAVRRSLFSLNDPDLADLLGHVVLNIDDSPARLVYRDLVSILAVDQAISMDREEAVLGLLSSHAQAPVFGFLGLDSSIRRAGGGYRENPYDLEDVPLGRRKSNARLYSRDLIFRLTADPSPEVIEILLKNPMTTESDAIRVAAQRPQEPAIFKVILSSFRFGCRERVVFAIAANPYCPVRFSLALIPMFSTVERRELAIGTGLDDRVRDAAHIGI